MSTPNTDKRQDAIAKQAAPKNPLPAAEPLTEMEARRAEAEALQRTQETSQEVIESRRRGRIEAETHRISDEVTRQAQERLRLEREQRERLIRPTNDPGQLEIATAAGVDAPRRTLPEPAHIDRVLVALDGTPYAERALPYCVAFAARMNAGMILAHVIETELAGNVLSKVIDHAKSEERMRGMRSVDTYLDTLSAYIDTSVAHVETTTLTADTAADGLIALLARTDAGVVALATHARQGVERRLLGSVGDTLIQCACVPVLLIPPGVDVQDTPAPTFRRILVPLDGSMAAEQALAPVLALAKSTANDNHHRMDIVLYHVVESRVTRPDGVRYVEEVRKRMLRTELPETTSVTAVAMVGSPPGSIASAAIHGLTSEPTYPERFDLVAMATHGRSGLQRWLYGSVAEYLLSHLSVPILLVRPEQSDM